LISTAHFIGLVASKVEMQGAQEMTTMAFQNDAGFEDDFRKVGADATAEFEPATSASNPTDHASSENLNVAPKDDDLEDDEVEEDEDLDDEEDDELEDDDDEEDDDEDEDEDLEDDEDEEEEDEDDDEYEDDDDEEEDDELEDDDDTVKARNTSAASAARRR
jgi:hypothetical protein